MSTPTPTESGSVPSPKPARAPVPARPGTTAVVYCEANFGADDGKTANGLVRHSEKYEIVSVIDSEQAGHDVTEKHMSPRTWSRWLKTLKANSLRSPVGH